MRVDTFNANGYLTNEVLAQGASEQQTYTYTRNSSNLITSAVDPLQRTTAYNSYDAYGHPHSITFLSGTPKPVTVNLNYDPVFQKLSNYQDPLGHTTSFAYDNFGNVKTITNALSNAWSITNNASGLPSTVKDPLGNAVQIGYVGGDISSIQDALGRVSTVFTDEVGRIAAVSDPLGNMTQYAYDVRDGLTSITDPLGA